MPVEFYYVPVALLLLASVLRLPGLIRNWRDPLLRSVSVVLVLGGVVFFFAAPPTIAKVNSFIGITNFSALLVYCLLTAASAAVINLTITWRGGSDRRRIIATRWCLGIYGTVVMALVTLFVLGDAPVERLRDFDTSYATAPYLREMIILYLLAHTLATAVLAFLCWQWSRDVAGLLRAGLVLIVVGSLLNLGYDVSKAIAVGARLAGHDWDSYSTSIAPPLAALSTFCQAIGFALPAIGQPLTHQWRSWNLYRRLAPLSTMLRGVAPHESALVPWWSSPAKRHLQRTCAIRDALAMLPLNPENGTEARAHALATGATTQRAAAAAAAVMVVVALDARSTPEIATRDFSMGTQPALAVDGEGLLLLCDALREQDTVACRSTAGSPTPRLATVSAGGDSASKPALGRQCRISSVTDEATTR